MRIKIGFPSWNHSWIYWEQDFRQYIYLVRLWLSTKLWYHGKVGFSSNNIFLEKSISYGVKMYKIAITNGYTWNFLIYTGQPDPMAGLGHAQTVVMNLLNGLEGCYRTVVADNFFTSISLPKRLMEHDTYLIGTMISNRVGSGSEVVQQNLRRGEVYGLQNKEGVKLIMWKDKTNVLMISTRPSDSATVVDTGNINSKNERTMKPQVVLDYNAGRIGTDLSDQLSSYYTCLGRSIKWYRKVAFELVFGTALVNSYLMYKKKLYRKRNLPLYSSAKVLYDLYS